jgi:hypothetical protein
MVKLFCAAVVVVLFAGSLAYIYLDAMADRAREQRRLKQARRLDLFNRTVYALWENPTRARGWYGSLDRSNWRR